MAIGGGDIPRGCWAEVGARKYLKAGLSGSTEGGCCVLVDGVGALDWERDSDIRSDNVQEQRGVG